MFGNYSRNPRNRDSQIRSTGISGRSSVRRVFDNSQCAHVWAQQSQGDGRSSNGNLFFRDATIYSYRYGWPLGTFTTLPDGRRAVVLNVESYSVSTSGHLSDVRRAIRGLDNLVTLETDADTSRLFADAETLSTNRNERRAAAFCALIIDEESKFRAMAVALANPRKRVYAADPSYYGNPTHADILESRVAALTQGYGALLHLATTCGIACPISDDDVSRYQADIRAAFAAFYDPAKLAMREKAATQRAARAALVNARKWFNAMRKGEYIPYKHRGRFAESFAALIRTRPESEWRDLWNEYQIWRVACECNQVEAALNPRAADIRAARQFRPRSTLTAEQWINGARGEFYQESPTLARRVGDTLETSRGANCPFSHAVVAFLKAQECRRAGTTWHRNGQTIRVGVFNVDSIDAEGNMRAGCHTIRWAEMLRLAVKEVPHLVKPSFGLPTVSRS